MRVVQLASLLAFALASIWYLMPRLRNARRAQALTALLWIHVFRYVALFTVSAQHAGYPISDAAVKEIVVGDVVGAAIALFAIALLRARSRAGLAFAWLLSMETIVDFGIGIHRKIIEPPALEVGGVLWMILGFFVPAVIVSVPLLIWQLYSRRNEPAWRSA
jgi:hypothetical protein